jgi:hypothetical protein
MGEVDKSKSLIVKIVSKWYDAGVFRDGSRHLIMVWPNIKEVIN